MKFKYEITKLQLLNGKIQNIINSFKFFIFKTFIVYLGLPAFFIITIITYAKSFKELGKYIFINILIIFLILSIYILIINIMDFLSLIDKNKPKNRFYFEFNSIGICIIENESRINFEWSNITRIVNAKQFIHIYITLEQKIFIPKNIFINQLEINKILNTLKENVSSDVFSNNKNNNQYLSILLKKLEAIKKNKY